MENNEKFFGTVNEIIKENGKDILRNPGMFSHLMMNKVPFLRTENNVMTMALNSDLYTYFLEIPEEKRQESVDRLRKEFNGILSENMVELVTEAVCRALSWDEIITSFSDPDKLSQMADNYYYGKNGVKKDYNIAFRWIKVAAEQGDAKSLFRLGVCYKNGYGTKADIKKAIEAISAAAAKGNIDAMYNLGLYYSNGDGVEEDAAKAFEWYGRAAKLDDSGAQINLAWCYANGYGTEKDENKAFYWYSRVGSELNPPVCVSSKNRTIADYNLALCYENGIGTEKDILKAVVYYSMLYREGDKEAEKALKRILHIEG